MNLPTKHVKPKLNQNQAHFHGDNKFNKELGTRTPTMPLINQYTLRGGRKLFPTSRMKPQMSRTSKTLDCGVPKSKPLLSKKNHGEPDSN